MTGPVKFGIIGAGAISLGSAREIQAHADAEIVAICDANTARVNRLGDALGVRQRYDNSRELIADGNVDAIYIAVPNVFHAPLAEEALERGKHVILEKPFALNAREARAVADAATRTGKLFMLGMNQRFVPAAQQIRSLVAAGRLGEIYHARACWLRRRGIPSIGTWFSSKALAGGGALLDIGVHMLDLSLYLMDNFRPEAVTGATYTRFGNRGQGEGGWGISDREDLSFDVDDFATALIKLAGGATLQLDVSWALHQGQANVMNVNLFGTEAGASVYPAELYLAGDKPAEYQVIQNPDAPLQFGHTSRFHNFVNAIRGFEALCVTLDQALAVQSIIDAIYLSCSTGREVRMS
ncbi:MAG: Gfo/Idh/MocA family protein [Pseudomonadota bacterium]